MNLRVFYLYKTVGFGWLPSSRQHNASLKPALKASPESPIKSFGVCACFFLVFSLSL